MKTMAVTVNMHEAKTNLSRLVQRALDGEEIVIGRAGKPLVKLVRAKPQKRRSILGHDRIRMADDFDAPLPEFKDCY